MLTTKVSLAEAAHMIETNGTTNTFVFEGRPGIGKSAMLKMIANRQNMKPRYIDCALLDLGDLQMPKVSDNYVRFVPNELFTSEDGSPLIIMLDEIGKAQRTVQNALLTLLLERRIGSHYLPEGSIVFATTNMTTDGVGDMMQAHAKNRVTFLTMRGPTADEWIEWGVNNGIDPMVMAWVKEYPQVMDCYTELDKDDANSNPYIFNPRKQQDAFVTPRSLEHASHITHQRKYYPLDQLIASLSGTIGEAGARDMQAFIDYADEVPRWDDIMEDPEGTKPPKNAIASVIMALGAVSRVNKDNVDAWMTFFRKLSLETQFMFVTNAMRSGAAGTLATNKQFRDWALEVNYTVSAE